MSEKTVYPSLFQGDNGQVRVKNLTMSPGGSTYFADILGDPNDNSSLRNALEKKQNKLIQGENIVIASDGKTISATFDALDVNDTEQDGYYVSKVDEEDGLISTTKKPLPSYQDTRVAGRLVTEVDEVDGKIEVSRGGISALAANIASVSDTTPIIAGNAEGNLAPTSALDVFSYIDTKLQPEFDKKQNLLEAGSNITLTALPTGKVKIDATGDVSVKWGEGITGNINDQTDLQDEFDTKQDKITDVSDTGVSGQVVYSVKQVDGQIQVERRGTNAFPGSSTAFTDSNVVMTDQNTGSGTVLAIKPITLLWDYIKNKIYLWCGITDDKKPALCASDQITIVKVSALPENPAANTLYLIG